MYTALVSAGTSTSSSFSFANLIFLLVLLAIGVPLVRRLRRSVSKKRKERWVKEGLLDPPEPGPEPADPRD
jgi:hypothetical protein